MYYVDCVFGQWDCRVWGGGGGVFYVCEQILSVLASLPASLTDHIHVQALWTVSLNGGVLVFQT